MNGSTIFEPLNLPFLALLLLFLLLLELLVQGGYPR